MTTMLRKNSTIFTQKPAPTETFTRSEPAPKVETVSYPLITSLVDNGWDYQRPLFIRSKGDDPISGYPFADRYPSKRSLTR